MEKNLSLTDTSHKELNRIKIFTSRKIMMVKTKNKKIENPKSF